MLTILYPILFCILLFIIIYFSKFLSHKKISKKIILIIFAIKLLSGFSLYAIYTYYYDQETSDIHKFYKGGKVLYSAIDLSVADYLSLVTGIAVNDTISEKYYGDSNFWTRSHDYGLYNDDRTIMRFNAIVCLFSFGNIYIHIIVAAFLSFIGSFALFKTFDKLLDINLYLIVLASFFIPSCLLWNSGMSKEMLTVFSFGFTSYFFVSICEKFKIKYLIGFLLSSFLLLISKIYILPLYSLALLFYVLTIKARKKTLFIAFSSIIIAVSILFLFSKQLLGIDILYIISGKQNDFINYTQLLLTNNSSTYELTRLQNNISSFISIIPEALLNSFCRPFITDVKSVFILFSFLELVFLFIALILSVVFFKKPDDKTIRFILFALLFVLPLFLLIGTTTPNIGALVRYRIHGLPFLLLIFFCITDYNRVYIKIMSLLKIKNVKR